MSIRIEDFQCEGILPILEAFPSYKSAIQFVMAFRPSFIKSPENRALQNHFIEHVIEEDGTEKWRLDGLFHRDFGLPAKIVYYKNGQISSEEWYQNGELHRIDGPASIQYRQNGEIRYKAWYQNGLCYHNE